LPGVPDKDRIELTVAEKSVCVTASGDDTEFLGCGFLFHKTKGEKAKAKFKNGLLSITIPLQPLPMGKKPK
jgi:HSP20 family molecular chaperone IbpA